MGLGTPRRVVSLFLAHLEEEAGEAVALLKHAVLDVDLALGRVLPREGRVQLRQHACGVGVRGRGVACERSRLLARATSGQQPQHAPQSTYPVRGRPPSRGGRSSRRRGGGSRRRARSGPPPPCSSTPPASSRPPHPPRSPRSHPASTWDVSGKVEVDEKGGRWQRIDGIDRHASKQA